MRTQRGEPMQKHVVTEKRYLLGPVGLTFATANTGSWRVERPVQDSEKCSACGQCAKYCPAGLAKVNKADHKVAFDMQYCKGCGICMNVCALHCITMQPERDFQ